MFDVANVAVLAPFLMVVGIVWVTSRAKLEAKRIEAGKFVQHDPGSTHRDEQVDELEERVRVLERIVTDGGYDLAHKIEALRDQRGVETRLETPDLQERT